MKCLGRGGSPAVALTQQRQTQSVALRLESWKRRAKTSAGSLSGSVRKVRVQLRHTCTDFLLRRCSESVALDRRCLFQAVTLQLASTLSGNDVMMRFGGKKDVILCLHVYIHIFMCIYIYFQDVLFCSVAVVLCSCRFPSAADNLPESKTRRCQRRRGPDLACAQGSEE